MAGTYPTEYIEVLVEITVSLDPLVPSGRYMDTAKWDGKNWYRLTEWYLDPWEKVTKWWPLPTDGGNIVCCG